MQTVQFTHSQALCYLVLMWHKVSGIADSSDRASAQVLLRPLWWPSAQTAAPATHDSHTCLYVTRQQHHLHTHHADGDMEL